MHFSHWFFEVVFKCGFHKKLYITCCLSQHSRQKNKIETNGTWGLLAFTETQQHISSSEKHWWSVFVASVCVHWEKVFIKVSTHYHAWDMWAAAASSSLTRLGHIEVIFAGFTQHCVRREASGGSNCPLWGRQCLHECGLWVARGQ